MKIDLSGNEENIHWGTSLMTNVKRTVAYIKMSLDDDRRFLERIFIKKATNEDKSDDPKISLN